MNNRLELIILLASLVIAFLAIPAIAGNTYVTNLDPNPVVITPDCYSFVINVDQASGSSATLTLQVYDVDEEDGELDTVTLNGVLLGYLSGDNGVWSTTTFNISGVINYIGDNNGDNTVQICIDPAGGESTWQAEIDWGQILVDGGSAEDADIVSVNASGAWNAISVQTNVSATNTDDFRLEINLLDSTNNNKDIATDVFNLTGGSSTTRTNIVSLPSEPTTTETFTIEANLFNHTTGVQQAIETTTWAYSADEPPTDITLDSDHVDENLPALSLVGTLDAVDADSTSHDFTLIGGDIGSFTISGSELRTAVSFDHESQASYSIHVEAEDAEGNAYSEWFTITIDDVNEAPTALDDAVSVIEGATAFVSVLSNDTDPDNDTLSVVSATDPLKGAVTIQLDDTIKYVPVPGACGIDTFSYTIEDGDGESASASITVTIQNVAPTAIGDAAETQEDESVLIAVLANDSDPGGNVPSIQSVGVPRYGNAVVVGDAIRYTPQARYEGSDRFSYTILDDCGASATGWIDIDVLHTNHLPVANVVGFYQGVVDEPLVLDASFSHDPDISDTLQYRWDLNGSGVANTGWLSNPRYTAIYSAPFFGQLILEVRDLYLGVPTGEISQATALVRIASRQSLQVFVFEDLNGDGIMDPGEPGLSGINVVIAEETMTTEADGGISVELDAGRWVVSITESAISQLESRGFAVQNTEKTVDLAISAVEVVTLGVVKTSTKLKGIIYADVNANGKFDEDDRLVEGVAVMLDGDEEGIVVTDATGSFSFRDVSYGSHEIYVEQTNYPEGETPLNILIPFTLIRTEKAEIQVPWPYDLGPQGGFLQVDVQRGGEE